ncbi:kinesin-like protein KIF13A isoform X2 [Scylla paramamosain]|uniref:kinesin-like protein KIF13A isoform X2 n=1 Tax=Scylla paramamosain TaxID=85552 RepID=UPI0030827C14
MDKIRVAVRVRPFNRREKELGSKSIVTMSGMQTILHHPTALDKPDRNSSPGGLLAERGECRTRQGVFQIVTLIS